MEIENIKKVPFLLSLLLRFNTDIENPNMILHIFIIESTVERYSVRSLSVVQTVGR